MSDRIGIMNEGVLQQVGSPHEVYEKPVNRFVADFIGETNFLPAAVARLETEEDYPMVTLQGGVRVLAANGCVVYSPPRQTCCGALQMHTGDRETAREQARADADEDQRGGGGE